MAVPAMGCTFGGVMLVTGTCIGAGMLSLPISTATSGFYPSMGAFLICWAMMLLTAFLMLEVSLWLPEQTNLITMARTTLGKKGAAIAWGCYVLFLYSLMTAYTAGGAEIIEKFLSLIRLEAVPSLWVMVCLFATIVYLGTRWVDWVNRLLMIGLIVTYLGLMSATLPRVNITHFDGGEPRFLMTVWPLLVTSFGFHLLIPSLKNYLHSDLKSLRVAIFLGSLLSLVVYLIWQVLVLGVVPLTGEGGLIAIQSAKKPVLALMQALSFPTQSKGLSLFSRVFSLFAILTSFVGVALGLFDFFADGFHVKKSPKGKLILALLTFLPPALFASTYPAAFLIALRYAGLFAAILLIIYPALMVYWGRYRLTLATGYRVAGGKSLILLALAFGAGVIILEVMNRFRWLN